MTSARKRQTRHTGRGRSRALPRSHRAAGAQRLDMFYSAVGHMAGGALLTVVIGQLSQLLGRVPPEVVSSIIVGVALYAVSRLSR